MTTTGNTQRLFGASLPGGATQGAAAPAAAPPAAAPPDAAPPTDAVPAEKIGPYVVMGLLGEGGVGRVFECHDEMLDRRVAVKLLRPERAVDPEHAARFLREARAMAKVQSPNVVTIYFVGEHEGAPYIVMERLLGDDMNVVLRDKGPLEPKAAIDVALDTVAGLKAAANAGLVHRDVKPANLFLTGGRVKVTDFGLARPIDGSADVTQAGLIVGTPYYLAPDILRGQPASMASDMYSLGATLFELVVGEPPFDAPSAIEILGAHRALPAPSLLDRRPAAGADLDAIVARLLKKTPAERYADWTELEAALQAARRGLSTPPAAAPSSTAELPIVGASQFMDVTAAASSTSSLPTVGASQFVDVTAMPATAPVAASAVPDSAVAAATVVGIPAVPRAADISSIAGSSQPPPTLSSSPAATAPPAPRRPQTAFASKVHEATQRVAAAWRVAPPARRAGLLAAVAAVVLVGAALATSRATPVERIDAGGAKQLLVELDAIPETRRDGPTHLLRGHALWATGAHKEALSAYAAAVDQGAADDRGLQNVLASLDGEKATKAENLLRKWPGDDVVTALREVLRDGSWYARRHALAVLTTRSAARPEDAQRLATVELAEGSSCARRKEGLLALVEHGEGAAALQAVQAAQARMPDNTCMRGDLDAALKKLAAR